MKKEKIKERIEQELLEIQATTSKTQSYNKTLEEEINQFLESLQN
ncbi:hypothetical protein [Cyanothece sp. BG0011]|nr:hypothetical protein [Cyanothece sp. BG0011]